MTTLNSTPNQSDDIVQECQSGEMSIDGSLIDKESPSRFVTFRKCVPNPEMQELRAELQAFQLSIGSMLEKWFAKQDDKFTKFIENFNDIKTSIKFINDNYEDLKTKTEDITKRVSALESRSTEIQANSARFVDLEAKLDVMEQQARQCNIEIGNLPEKRGENLIVLLEDVAVLVKNPINKQDIVSIHRVPQANANSQRPKNVVVKFSSRLLRDGFVSAVRLHKGITSDQLKVPGPSHKIYVNEHLTLKNKSLFRQSREAAKQCGFRFVWVKHGAILVRRSETSPVFSVRSEKDLAKINTQVK